METRLELKEASYYKRLKNKIVQCQLCPHYCIIKDNERGKCRVRQNFKGRLYTLVYGKPCSVSLDPIEKKPFYHFMPGQQALSIATPGCNLHCKHCQNWEISQAKPEDIPTMRISPKQLIDRANELGARIISYTYTEPTIFYEYMLDTAKLAKKQGIKNTIVSNGFINPEPLKELCSYIDAANIDLKSISGKFYREVCDARVEPVLETLKILKKNDVWIEVTNLIIPTLNDNISEIKKLISWIKDNLGKDTPLHFTAFYPCYKLVNLPYTPIKILQKARKLALKSGLNYVYTGNLPDEEGSATYCPNPKCKKTLIRRQGYFSIIENNLAGRKCKFCKATIAGIWK
jgi:pyruvate formate lyase activating enzyme